MQKLLLFILVVGVFSGCAEPRVAIFDTNAGACLKIADKVTDYDKRTLYAYNHGARVLKNVYGNDLKYLDRVFVIGDGGCKRIGVLQQGEVRTFGTGVLGRYRTAVERMFMDELSRRVLMGLPTVVTKEVGL